MPPPLQRLGQRSLDWFIDQHLLGSYQPSGRFAKPRFSRPLIPEEFRRLAHYRNCVGALYRDRADWEFAYRLIAGFTLSGRKGGHEQLMLPSLYGRLPAKLEKVLEQLPFAFEQAGFQALAPNPGLRELRFRASGNCRVSDLPEPYGKWQQIQLGRPRWDERVELEVEAHCTLRGLSSAETGLAIELSAIAPPVLDDLARALSARLQARPPLPPPAPAYLLIQLDRAHRQGRLGDWIAPCMRRAARQLQQGTLAGALPAPSVTR